jgi:cobalt-zinc-cadmium efflux system membrane fusion protein
MANPRQMFKIGMYVNVAFGALGVAEKSTASVPKDAVQTINNQQVVFVATDKATDFIVRPVRVGPENNGFYPVREGLTVGERVVVSGSFLLRAEWMKTHPSEQIH